MTIKAGELAFVKTTGEAVFVLEYPTSREPSKYLPDFKEDTLVRRPIMGQQGVVHSIDYFRYNELETLDEQRKRFLFEREEILTKYAPAAKVTPVDDGGFFSN